MNLKQSNIISQPKRILSWILSGVCGGLALLLPLFMAIYWFFAPDIYAQTETQFQPDMSIPWAEISWERVGTGYLFAAALVNTLGSLLVSVALWSLHGLFAAFANGEYLSEMVLLKLDRMTRYAFIALLIMPVTTAITGVILTWPNPPGQRMLFVTLNSHWVFALIGVGLFWLIASILKEALRLKEENQQII